MLRLLSGTWCRSGMKLRCERRVVLVVRLLFVVLLALVTRRHLFGLVVDSFLCEKIHDEDFVRVDLLEDFYGFVDLHSVIAILHDIFVENCYLLVVGGHEFRPVVVEFFEFVEFRKNCFTMIV